MRVSLLRALSLAALSISVTAHAQTLRGIAVDASNQPVPGVVVMLLDSASRVAARGITNSQGEFRLTAGVAGSYRLRTLRIGFRPTVSAPRMLAAGAEISDRVVLANIPVALDTVRTTSRNVCRAFTDSAAATFAVWQQVHAALTAADLTAAARIIVATTLSYERTLDPNSPRGREQVLKQNAKVSTSYVARPWRELPADALHRGGYVVEDRDNDVTYYAPGLDVLLSDGFLEDHCFRLASDPKSPSLVGIAFEPTPDRKKVAEIRGTMWVDRASAELRRMEFQYANVSREQQEVAGGRIEFERAKDGTWLISRWDIRMPVLERDARVVVGRVRDEIHLAAIQVSGGEVALARKGADTIWARPPLIVRGSIRDSVSNDPIAAAEIALVGTQIAATADANGGFVLHGALPGEYTAEVQTRSLDSVNTVHRTPVVIVDSLTPVDLRVPSGTQFVTAVCGRNAKGGVIIGSAGLPGATDSHGALTGLRITAEWSSDPNDPARMRRTEVRGAANGSFRICDVPVNTPIALRASADSSAMADAKLVRLSPAVRLVRTDLTLLTTSELARRGATFIGTVISDSAHLPVAGAEVSMPDLGKSTSTDSAGAFRIVGIAPGEQRIVVRRIGYGAADTKLKFTGFETVERRVVLGKAVTLEGVTVTAQANDRTMPGFEDNRRVGLGHFMTRVELEKFTGMQLGTALDQLAGIATMRANGHLWVISRHQPAAACGPKDTLCFQSAGYYMPSVAEAAIGMPGACFAQVYIDGALMNGLVEPTDPFDLSTVVPESVEAVEWYAGPSETPLKYTRMASACGVLVIWTRKNP